jgi:hypothetical protein
LLITIGYIFVTEGPGEEYAAAKSQFWQKLLSWRSNASPELATSTFYVAIVLLAIILAIACVSAFRRIFITRQEDASRNRLGLTAVLLQPNWSRMFELRLQSKECISCGICMDVCRPKAVGMRQWRGKRVEGNYVSVTS